MNCGHTERDDRGCVECRRTRDREAKRRKAGKPRKPKSRNLMLEARQERDLTRLILEKHAEWEREQRADIRAELRRQYEAMRA